MIGIGYEQLQLVYENLNKQIDNMVEKVKNSKEIVSKLNNNGSWDGKGFDYYNDNFNDFSYNFGAYLNELYILNKQLLSVIEKYKQVDNQIIQHGGSGGKF